MSNSLLWAVDVYGKVYSLSTTRGRWEPSKDSLLELKRVTAGPRRSWGVGCDHHVYLNILPSVEPIRFREETYENQRWNPVEGFTDVLLPTDRWAWSDVTGAAPQPLHGFRLPSASWEWEGDWYVDQSRGGDHAGAGVSAAGDGHTHRQGWEYAVDFPANFSREKKWQSCVRRRRWFRYRRYRDRGTWAKIPLDHPKRPPLPLSDISCGGWEMSDQPGRQHFLWAVSQQGQVWFREGIQSLVPEGSGWEEVAVPREVSQVCAGPGDLLWAVLWDGQLLARTGISLDSPTGTSWAAVEAPGKEGSATHVAVGVGVVWVLTKDYKVWFRRGVNSHNPCGSGWIGVGGEMIMVDVGLNDQVWGVGEDRGLYFRMGVTPGEPSGSGWIPVLAHWGSSVEVVPLSDSGEFRGQVTGASQGSVLGCDDPMSDALSGDAPRSPSPSSSSTSSPSASRSSSTTSTPGHAPKPRLPNVTSDSFISSLVSDREKAAPPAAAAATPEAPQGEDPEAPPTPSLPSPAVSPDVPWSTVDLEGAEAARSPPEAGPPAAAVYPLALEPCPGAVEEEGPVWAWVSGGGCDVESGSLVSWLSPTGPLTSSVSLTPVQSAAWTEEKETEKEKEVHRDGGSKKPVERSTSVWVRKGTMRWWRDWPPRRWVDVGVALEQSTNNDSRKDSIFFIYYTQYGEKKYLHVFVKEVTALVPVLSDTHHPFAVYTAQRTKQRWPLLLAAHTEKDMNDWMSLLLDFCCESRGIRGPPSRQALWSVTSKGDVMVHEPSACLEASAHTLPCDLMFWRQVPGHLRCVECNSLGVVWGVGCDGTAWVYTGRRGEEPAQGGAGCVRTQTDVRSVYIYENQRWNPMTGYTDKGLPRDRAMWSDESGLKECTKSNTHPPSAQWTWVTEWTVDQDIPGGTDKDGWQYAPGFPVTFHGHKTMKDFVRRRRWARKCEISLSAPWQQVPPVPLRDITVLPCLAQSSMEQVPVWALSDKGDVLCRLGVTPLKPEGTSWLHVGTDQPFKSISIGGANQVWAIARDGAVFYRGSVSAQNPAGECWYHIPSPLRQTLKQLSVGRTSVYAVDENSNLWYRQGLTPSYPQGSAWELISSNVSKVSVGPLDQVWIIADGVPGFPAETPGAVCHRLGVGPVQPKGQSWDYGIGGGWEHLSVRGNATEAPRASHHPALALGGSPRNPRSPLPSSPRTPRSPLPASPLTARNTLPPASSTPLPACPSPPCSPLPPGSSSPLPASPSTACSTLPDSPSTGCSTLPDSPSTGCSTLPDSPSTASSTIMPQEQVNGNIGSHNPGLWQP